jgi:hypothetical protein
MEVENTQAYYDSVTITAVKSFKAQAPAVPRFTVFGKKKL